VSTKTELKLADAVRSEPAKTSLRTFATLPEALDELKDRGIAERLLRNASRANRGPAAQ